MIKSIIRYLFRRNRRALIPLLPLHWTSEYGRYGNPPPQLAFEVQQLKAHRIARTDQDAYRLILEYKLPVKDIIKAEQRKRRKRNIFTLAWKRFKRLL